jgi:hypothetical protein
LKKQNLYQGEVEAWVGYFLLDALGIEHNEDDFTVYELSEDLIIFLGTREKMIIEVERVKISTYFGYAITLNYLPSTRKIFTLEKEYYEGEESYRVEPFNKAYANALSVWKKSFQGRTKWPR